MTSEIRKLGGPVELASYLMTLKRQTVETASMVKSTVRQITGYEPDAAVTVTDVVIIFGRLQAAFEAPE